MLPYTFYSVYIHLHFLLCLNLHTGAVSLEVVAIFFPAFRCLAPGGAILEGADVFFFATAFFFLSALVADFFSFDFVLASCFRFCANPEK
jgi:hypothetical protein